MYKRCRTRNAIVHEGAKTPDEAQARTELTALFEAIRLLLPGFIQKLPTPGATGNLSMRPEQWEQAHV